MATATEACARCGRTDTRLTLTSRGPLCPSRREELVAANRESAAVIGAVAALIAHSGDKRVEPLPLTDQPQ
jgi:hypothetical protein